MADELYIALTKAFEEYTDDVIFNVKEAIEETAKETVEDLKETSPDGRRKGAKKYKRGWSYRDESDRIRARFVVYNKQGRLTHLLENGHGLWYGGRAKAIPHIKPSEERAIKLVERKLISKLNN